MPSPRSQRPAPLASHSPTQPFVTMLSDQKTGHLAQECSIQRLGQTNRFFNSDLIFEIHPALVLLFSSPVSFSEVLLLFLPRKIGENNSLSNLPRLAGPRSGMCSAHREARAKRYFLGSSVEGTDAEATDWLALSRVRQADRKAL